jgi:lysophospholipase L1-like esterase
MFPEHDRNGFRNKAVPNTADIIAMGDSQTYGTNVRSEETWPKQLGRIAGAEAYNMAFGGYCPIHTLLLADEAVQLRPKVVIEAFYTGNDLFDCYTQIYSAQSAPELRNPEWQAVQSFEEKRESDKLLSEAVSVTKPPWLRTKDFIIERVKLAAALRLYKSVLPVNYSVNPGWESVKAYASGTQGLEIFERGNVRTIFTAKSRLLAEDLSDRRIREGLRLAQEALRRINESLNQRNVRFVVLAIPTKEFVFEELVREQGGGVSQDYDNLIKYEKLILENMAEFCGTNGIPFVSAVPALRQCLEKGEQPYRIDDDGHPSPTGHRAIAATVLSELRKLKLID